MRILVTGAGGLLGVDLSQIAKQDHEVFDLPRRLLDVTDFVAVDSAVSRIEPDVVFNLAAYTNVDAAEGDGFLDAYQVNSRGAGHVAEACRRHDAFLVHLSSSGVFDGRASSYHQYLESDQVGPINTYGYTKMLGELVVAGMLPDRSAIVRTSWLYGANGPCFVNKVLEQARAGSEVSVVRGSCGSPTYSVDLARALLQVAVDRTAGVMHVAGEGTSWRRDLALAAMEFAGLDVPVETVDRHDDYPVERPRNNALRTERVDVPSLRPWREALEEYVSVGSWR